LVPAAAGLFPVDPRRPGPSSLRLAVDLLQAHQQLVVFPEGRIRQEDEPLRLMPGLARLAQLAQAQGVPVQVLPVGIAYGHRRPQPGDRAALCLARPSPWRGGSPGPGDLHPPAGGGDAIS
jgi:1-acyl-sn-glycerol-3-phosphate acyltransferase